MKKFYLLLIALLLVGSFTYAAVSYFGTEQATCTGASPCKACKNCKYCKHCAKDGGTCGICKKK